MTSALDLLCGITAPANIAIGARARAHLARKLQEAVDIGCCLLASAYTEVDALLDAGFSAPQGPDRQAGGILIEQPVREHGLPMCCGCRTENAGKQIPQPRPRGEPLRTPSRGPISCYERGSSIHEATPFPV